ncbi:MAG: tetratricopeptide repeat protein, partial [Bacteroidetes bacterium]|nr:tetratricopeptide repeat protein [Bacteroidota bacterium]
LATKENAGTMSNDVLNNPFVDTTNAQRYATIFLTWLLYLKLLIFPWHLSYDYNYNQIPVTDFSNPLVLLSIAIHIGLFVVAIYCFRRKPVYSFSILFYFITFSVVSNIFFNTGTPLAERFVLIPGIGFCLAIVAFFINAFEKLKLKKTISLLLITSVIVFFTIRNILRCGDWKDNNTLFLADVTQTPNSAKSQLNAGIACLNLATESTGSEKENWINQSFTYLQKGISIYPKKIDGYINMGVGYSWKNEFDNAEVWWKRAKALNPLSPELTTPNKVLAGHYFKQGMQLGVEKNYAASIKSMLHAWQYDTLNAEISFNLGGAYYTLQIFDSAAFYFQKTLLLNPEYQNAANGLQAATIARNRKKEK